MEQLISFIIRPPRAEYNPKNDLLDQEFMLKGKWYQRKDLEVVNSRGDTLQCSHYMPVGHPEGRVLPCVIYCHGNSGCRADASEAAIILLPSNITVFTLDFSGSGLSGGDHVTLGWNEKDDLRAVVDYLRADGNVSLIGLWGRSMGAVTSLMYGAEDPSIAGMVLDSPFSDLVDLMMELVDTYKVRLPKFTVKFAIQYMRRAILKKAKFDITDLNTIKVAKCSFVPVLFGHAVDDDFIQPHHSDRVFDAYVGDKNIIKFEGDHNSPRPQFYFDSISIFFNNVLQPPENEVGAAFFDLSHDYYGKGSWTTVHDTKYLDDISASPSDQAGSTTEDAINQVRSRRPMSKIVVPAEMSSNDKQSDCQEEGTGSDSLASSSNMISFEFSGGSPHGTLPASIDDDEYVEYPLDSLADFPSNVEEEEKMFMKAVMESLKDLETGHPHVEEPSSHAGTNLPEPTHELYDSFSTPAESLKTLSTTSATTDSELTPQILSPDTCKLPSGPALKSIPSSEAEINRYHSDISTSDHCGPEDMGNYPKATVAAVNNPKMDDATPSPNEAERNGAASRGDTPLGNQSSSDTEMADHTRVTVKVVKNPTTNIMDGLFRRWDLNFFKNR
ncbi:alpha/beta-hydrolase superfamily protein [Forsythia ovata]|uniref:Alpha/beta-hydrolase superfamily protein n=1 Tax=Forsythia ovata TaxID=205694 RepID=A0ABD1P5N0_9LAMI